MENLMVLIMVDECGDEVEYGRYNLSPEIQEDEDALDIWKERKIERASSEYPEASGFYWEDRRNWNRMIIADIAQWF